MKNMLNWTKELKTLTINRMTKETDLPNNIPKFPIFASLKISHKDFVSLFAEKYPYSTFNFANFWAWDIHETRKISVLNGNLVLLMQDYVTDEKFFTFAGSNSPNNTAKTLLKYADKYDYLSELRFIPEEIAEKINSKNINSELDTNNSEYIYKTETIFKLEGKKLKSKRNRIRVFEKENPEAVFKIKRLKTNILNEIDHLFELWEMQTSKEDREMSVLREHTALMRLIKFSPNANLLLSTVYDKGKLISFSIDEVASKKMAIGHFVKADRDKKGIYEFINGNTAKYLSDQGVIYWNWQQDLGIPGLKKLKISYQPDHLKNKYTLSL